MKSAGRVISVAMAIVLGFATLIALAFSAGATGPHYRLFAGERLSAGESLNGNLGDAVVMQSDGNLVIYTVLLPGGALVEPAWSSGTVGHPGAYLILQDDGNLVIYSVNNIALWSTRTDGSGSNQLVMQPDGNLVLYSGNTPVWDTHTYREHVYMEPDRITGSGIVMNIASSDSRFAISSGSFYLNANFRGPGSGGFLWYFNCSTYSTEGPLPYDGLRGEGVVTILPWPLCDGYNPNTAVFLLQSDGNLVYYRVDGGAMTPLWSTHTDGTGPNNVLVLQNDGNLVLYSADYRPLWSSLTSGHQGGPNNDWILDFKPCSVMTCSHSTLVRSHGLLVAPR